MIELFELMFTARSTDGRLCCFTPVCLSVTLCVILAIRLSLRLSVCPSVDPSVTLLSNLHFRQCEALHLMVQVAFKHRLDLPCLHSRRIELFQLIYLGTKRSALDDG